MRGRFAVSLALFTSLSLALPAFAVPKPLTLSEAISRALATHPDAAIARTQLAQADLGVADVQAQRLQFSADASLLGRHAQTGLLADAVPSTTLDQTGVNGTVGLTIPVFTGGKLTQGLRAARSNRDATAFQGVMTRAQLTFEVTRAYWNLVRQEALIQVQEETLNQAQRTLSLTKAGFALGRQTSHDVDRAEVDALNTQDSLMRVKGAAEEARVRLAALLGMPASDVILAPPGSLVSTQVAASALTAQDATWPDLDEAVAAHPRVRAAQAQLEAAEARIAAAQGERWPQLAVVTTYQHGNNPFDPLSGARGLGSFSGTWDARVSANLNVFDNGRISREVAKAVAERDIAQGTLDKTRREVRSSIEVALIKVQSAKDRLALAGRASGVADKTLSWVETRYEQGYSLLVDVLESRRSLLTARTQKIEAEIDYQIARAELALALGKTE